MYAEIELNRHQNDINHILSELSNRVYNLEGLKSNQNEIERRINDINSSFVLFQNKSQ